MSIRDEHLVSKIASRWTKKQAFEWTHHGEKDSRIMAEQVVKPALEKRFGSRPGFRILFGTGYDRHTTTIQAQDKGKTVDLFLNINGYTSIDVMGSVNGENIPKKRFSVSTSEADLLGEDRTAMKVLTETMAFIDSHTVGEIRSAPASRQQIDYALGLLRRSLKWIPPEKVPSEDQVRSLDGAGISDFIEGLKRRRGEPLYVGNLLKGWK
jgi:hypothetical protein